MLKNNHKLARNISNKEHASVAVDIQSLVETDNSSIQIRAYQIYQEKGGSAFDNWLEAERILRNLDHDTNSLSTSSRRGSGGGG
jgi:hypothetical protein